MDGNDSILSSDSDSDQNVNIAPRQPKLGKHEVALNLPKVAVYNARSLFPKIMSLKTDMFEREISLSFITEIWEQSENKEHISQIESLLEMDGLKYISTPRPKTTKGGGAAIIVNLERFSLEKLDVIIPSSLDVVWGMLKPRNGPSKFKRIIVCSFYSPPKNRKNSRLADHLVGTLHMLNAKYPDSGIIMGADKNTMNITPLLSCGLRLHQIVDKVTINFKTLDIIIMNLKMFYNSPIIAPPLLPDDPENAKPSDHSVPVCTPHTDRYNPPHRNYKLHTYRPLPDSSVRKFGQWITAQRWEDLSHELPVTELTSRFENTLKANLNKFCPEKTIRISSQDKPWVNSELKKLHRLKSREWTKRGKTKKYLSLSQEFKLKYQAEAQKYMDKNVESLKETNPGRAYSTLKRMGAQPGDCSDSHTFTLPSHQSANLTPKQSAECIAEHFSEISKTFPPLSVDLLPERVKTKLRTDTRPPPVISVDETWRKIESAKKPRSGVPCDLPREITKEFSVELATPLNMIINKIAESATWPNHWKKEYITPIGKVPEPETEDDLRPISLTPFFSKVTEHFVIMWLLEYIENQIDFRQYGGVKGNSITHYLIEFINFILSNQENRVPTAVLACLIDFSKAFNRQNHNILITKLSDMGVPAWLLRIVMSFLSDRNMVVRYKGETSSSKPLPGGGPQGTLLGLLLFIVLINDVGFLGQSNNAGDLITCRRYLREANKIHFKFVDDLTVAESIILKDNVHLVPDRPLPDSYHARTGHALNPDSSEVYKQIRKINEYAVTNDMKLNAKKTKFMLFNNCKTIDFLPNLELEGKEVELVEEMKVLGVVLTSDMKFSRNTEYIVERAFKRVWMLKRLLCLGASVPQLVDVYLKQVRSVLELAVPAWHSSLTVADKLSIERVQKASLQVILGETYISYSSALDIVNLQTLEQRRQQLCRKFGFKALKNIKHNKWFKVNQKISRTRQKQPFLCPVVSRTKRFENSPLSYLTKLLNIQVKTS